MMIFWFAIGDDFDVTRWNFADFPADLSKLPAKQRDALLAIAPKLEKAMENAVQFKLNAGRRVGNYNLAKCRDVTDESDRILAEALGLQDAWERLHCSRAVLSRSSSRRLKAAAFSPSSCTCTKV